MKRTRNRKVMVGLVAVALSVEGVIAQSPAKIVVDGSTTVGPIAKAFAEYYMAKHPDVDITVNESGSGNGAKSLINGTCDIADMSRFMKKKEFAAAVQNGVLPVAHAIAIDAVCLIVHPSNPVRQLTLEQVRDIYRGAISNWKEVGGPDKPIVVISRDTNSGTYETFERLVMTHKVNGEKIREKIKPGAEYVGSNGAVRARVQSTPYAIGYVGLGFVDKTVKALEISGVYPSRESIASGRYPISRPLFMFTNGYPKLGTHLHAFVTLYLTEKGQEIIEEIGFVPLTRY